jgi:hypothetical protein
MISTVQTREHPEVELSPAAATVLCILLTDLVYTNTENPEGLLNMEAQKALAVVEQGSASIEPDIIVAMRERRGIEDTAAAELASRMIGVLQATLCTMLAVALEPERLTENDYSSSEEDPGYESSTEDEEEEACAQGDIKTRIKVKDLVKFRRNESLRPL